MNYRLSFFSLTVAALVVPSEVGAADDTYACLDGSGPLITVSKNFGYTPYKNRRFTEDTRFDGNRGRWLQQQYPTKKNAYPINIGGGKNGCWAGGTVEGTSDLDATWKQLYSNGNSAGIIWYGEDLAVDGIRIHNNWDSLRPASNSPNFIIQNTWVSRSRDDCVENDNANPDGLIADSLFDGCYVFYSSTTSSPVELTVENSLIRLEPMPGAHNDGPSLQPGHKAWLKGATKLRLRNNVFMQEQKSNTSSRLAGIPRLKKSGAPVDEILDCSNNVMVWTGPGDYPYNLDRDCFTVTKDESVWDDAKENWINCHPEVRRLAGDPAPNPSKCDPNAYGGG